MNHRISKYFDIRELVSPIVYDKYREYAWQFFDPRLLDTLLIIREAIAKPIVINNWATGGQHTQRGLRSNVDPLVKEKTALEKLYLSAHIQGMAIDFNVVGMSTKEFHEWLKKNQILLPHPIRVEENTDGWVHIDVRSDGFRAITWFKG